MRLRWTIPAAEDLYRIVQHVQKDNPAAANDVANTLYDGCGTLTQFPRRGRKGRIPGTRELVFSNLPYIVVYKVHDELWKSCAFIMAPKIGLKFDGRRFS